MTDQTPANAMVLVPVEPAEAMVTAAIVAFNNGLSPRNILHAGIAAAPPAPAGRAEVERLRELSERATPGVWFIGKPFASNIRGNPVTPIYSPQEGRLASGNGVGQWLIAWLFKNATGRAAADAAFIVAAVNHVRAALAATDVKAAEAGDIEVDATGEAMVCTGCGTTRTVIAIRRMSATAFTCCPERKMVPVRAALRKPS